MELKARLEAGFPPGIDDGFRCLHDDVTTSSDVPDLMVLQEAVVADGLVQGPGGAPLTTPPGRAHIFVIGECGKIHVALGHGDREEGAVKHNTLQRAQPCWGAGEIVFDVGRVVKVNAKSGSYRPPRTILPFVKELLVRAEVKVDDDAF